MTELLDLCYDVLIRILQEVNPEDLATCAQTSWTFNNFLKDNRLLYKAQYLKNFDDPRRYPTDAEPSWITELQKIVQFQKIMLSGNLDVKRENLHFVNTTTIFLINKASEHHGHSLNATNLTNLFEIPGNIDAFLYKSTLYSRRSTTAYQKAASTEGDRQLSAKAHCIYGFPTTTIGRRALMKNPEARSRVYDLRGYTSANLWGPFLSDGSMRVDWEMIEAIMVILSYNSALCCRRFLVRFQPPWSEPFEGVVRERYQNKVLPEWKPELLNDVEIPLSKRDPYGIEGIWSRIVCFLDYNDLYQFNFGEGSTSIPISEPREPLQTDEAIRHILMRLRVSGIEAPGEDDHPSHPVVHFTGSSKAIDAHWDANANSKIKGSVRMTKEGEIRWTTISVLYGEERWRSEGIQVGGLGATRGVVGTWFDIDYDPHGPAGPTGFWKLSELETPTPYDDEDDSDSDMFEVPTTV